LVTLTEGSYCAPACPTLYVKNGAACDPPTDFLALHYQFEADMATFDNLAADATTLDASVSGAVYAVQKGMYFNGVEDDYVMISAALNLHHTFSIHLWVLGVIDAADASPTEMVVFSKGQVRVGLMTTGVLTIGLAKHSDLTDWSVGQSTEAVTDDTWTYLIYSFVLAANGKDTDVAAYINEAAVAGLTTLTDRFVLDFAGTSGFVGLLDIGRTKSLRFNGHVYEVLIY
jgi:hypothetical protein